VKADLEIEPRTGTPERYLGVMAVYVSDSSSQQAALNPSRRTGQVGVFATQSSNELRAARVAA
jgi:hypothetical protein